MHKYDTCEHCGHARLSHRNGRGLCFSSDAIGYPCTCMRFKKAGIEVTIKPIKNDREIYIITNKKGRCFYINSARPFLSEQQIRELWKTDKKSFDPYFGQYGY